MAKFEIDIPDDVIADFNESKGRRSRDDGDDAVNFFVAELRKYLKGAVVQHRVHQAQTQAARDTAIAEDARVVIGVTTTVPPEPRGGGGRP